MGILKRFNREQLTLGAAGLLGVLLFGWQLARGGVEGAGGELPKIDRLYSIARQSPIEFLDANFRKYVVGREFFEPPATGRLPIPEIRPPEPKLGQMMLPWLGPRPDDRFFNKELLSGKFRTVGASVQTKSLEGFPAEAEIVALKEIVEPDRGGVVDKRRQLMRPPGGLAKIHRFKPNLPVEGRIVLDSHETGDQSIVLEKKDPVGEGSVKITVQADEIDRAAPGTDEGVERGGEFEKDYKRRASKLKADDADGHEKLGKWCREKAGMLPEARTEYVAVVATLRKRGETGLRMRESVLYFVEILRGLGNYDEAIDAMQDYIESVKGNTSLETADLHLQLGQLYAALGYHERSMISYEAAFALEPGRAPPRIALARAWLNLGQADLALEQIGALLVGGGPPEPEALAVQGLARLHRGQAAAAEDSFNESLKVRPNNAEALNGLGVALALQKKPDAPARFLAAIKADQYQIDAWLNLAILYVAEGRVAEADILFSGAAQRDPDSSTAAAGPGFIALLKGAYAEAAPAFERARKIQPDDYFMAYALGRLKLREGRGKDALELFRAALKSNPEYLPATTDAALAYLVLARQEPRQAEAYRVDAETLLETAYRADPTSHSANAALGCVYASRGKVREAYAAFDRAMRIGVADPLIDYGRGYVDYWYGAESAKARLDLAEQRFKYGYSHPDLKDPSDLEWKNACGTALQRIEDWRTQRVQIEEHFDGGQPSLTNQWIPVNLNNNPNEPQARYGSDRATIGDATGTSLSGSFAALEHRDLPRDFFLSIEGTLIFDSSQGFEAGFSLYTTAIGPGGAGSGLHFVFLEDATASSPKPIRLYYGMISAIREKGPNRPNMPLGTLPAAPSRVRFKLERRDDPAEQKTWLFDFSVWDDAKGAWRLLTEKTKIKVQQGVASAPTWMMQFWGRTLTQGRKWSFGVDDVRVLVVEK